MLDPQIYELDLPDPSPKLLQAVREFCQSTPVNPRATEWLNECNSIDNAVEFFFELADPVNQVLRQEYGHYFPGADICALVGYMRSPGSEPACLPPHCDQARAMAINYYISTGGDNVITSYYDFNMPPLMETGRNYTYDQVTKVGHYKFKTNQWYAFDASQCHSVENIESDRVILIIGRVDDFDTYTINDFINENNHIKMSQVFMEKQ